MSIEPQVSVTGAETQQALVELIGDYMREHSARVTCRTDSATVLGWIEHASGYSQRLADIFARGKVELHEQFARFREANQAYCALSKVA